MKMICFSKGDGKNREEYHLKHYAVISAGTNLGNLKINIREMFSRIEEYGNVSECSGFYRTDPYGLKNQPRFINFAFRLETELEPLPLMDSLHHIEAALGRSRLVEWGPRTMDLDMIYYDRLVMNSEKLTLPHWDMHRRLFVLRPVCDIDPEYIHPVFNISNLELLKKLEMKNHQ